MLSDQIQNLHARVLAGDLPDEAELLEIVRLARAAREGAADRAAKRAEANRAEVDFQSLFSKPPGDV